WPSRKPNTLKTNAGPIGSNIMESARYRNVPTSAAAGAALVIGLILLFTLFLGLASCVVWVIGIFQLSPETIALRQSAMQSIGGTWDKKIALHAGWSTLSLVRLGLHC